MTFSTIFTSCFFSYLFRVWMALTANDFALDSPRASRISVLYLSIYSGWQSTLYYFYTLKYYSPLKLILKLGAPFLPFLDFIGGRLMIFHVSDIEICLHWNILYSWNQKCLKFKLNFKDLISFLIKSHKSLNIPSF